MRNNRKFINSIRIKEADTIDIVYKLKKKEMNIKNLTETQKKEICLFLQNEIINKRKKLTNLKNMILLYSKEKK